MHIQAEDKEQSCHCQGFKPLNAVHQHLCAFHVYAHDRTRPIEAHHFCRHARPDFLQCIIYDSPDEDARLIGIEYLVSEEVFNSLPEEEKKYWHSHKYEVSSGMLHLVEVKGKDMSPGAKNDREEQPVMLELYKAYGKIIHTWAFDIYPDLPLGPPNLMMSYTDDGQLDPKYLDARDARCGMLTQAKKELREGYLPPYEKNPGADTWEKTGKANVLKPIEHKVKLASKLASKL